jgi:hypothetical protein
LKFLVAVREVALLTVPAMTVIEEDAEHGLAELGTESQFILIRHT